MTFSVDGGSADGIEKRIATTTKQQNWHQLTKKSHNNDEETLDAE